MIVISTDGLNYVVGLVDKTKPLLKIPASAVGWKVRCRPDNFAYIFIRYADGIEKRAVVDCGDHYEVADWIQQSNIRGE